MIFQHLRNNANLFTFLLAAAATAPLPRSALLAAGDNSYLYLFISFVVFWFFFIFHTFFINEHNQIIFLLWAINNNSAKFPLISYLFHRHTHANEIFHFVSRFVFVFDEFSHLLLSWERFPVAVFQTKYTRSLYTYTRIRRSNRILHSCLLTNFFFSGAK